MQIMSDSLFQYTSNHNKFDNAQSTTPHVT